MSLRVCAPLGLAFLLACETGSDLDNLRARSAFEMRCPAGELEIVNLDDAHETYGVSGCGQRAVYVYHCADELDTDCKWILNSTSSPRDD